MSSSPVAPATGLSSEANADFDFSPDQLFAAVDLGSNSFHLIVARYEHGTLIIVDRIKEMVRLAEGVNSKGQLSAPVANRALECLARFGQRLAGLQPDRIAAVGTNALRKMRDGWRFLEQAEDRLGCPIEVISGEEEARLIYLGVAHGVSEEGRQRLVIDIGGGSTELVIGREFNAVMVESLFFGCVAITQKFFGDGRITAKRWRKASAAVLSALRRYAPQFRELGWQEVFGSSGSMRAAGAVSVAQGWTEFGISKDSVAAIRKHLLDAGHIDQISLSGLSERRQPVFVGGMVVVEACMSELELDHVLVTDYALREGLLYDLIGRIEHPDPRVGAVRSLQQRYPVDKAHAQAVADTAAGLLDQVAGRWHLEDEDLFLLRAAAHLHELGLSIAHHGYHRHGAYLLEHSDLPGFSKQEQKILAVLVHSHRGAPVQTLFDELPERLQKRVRRLAILLRLAVVFNRDRLHQEVPIARLKAAKDENQLKLHLQEDWLAEHPLTAADLESEQASLNKIDATLKLVQDNPTEKA
ncbi:MAG: exopolyphosphatase [Pseudomonadota bacterium]